jgi:hypothetical protein
VQLQQAVQMTYQENKLKITKHNDNIYVNMATGLCSFLDVYIRILPGRFMIMGSVVMLVVFALGKATRSSVRRQDRRFGQSPQAKIFGLVKW